MLPLTPSQTVGPFFALLGPARGRLVLATDETPGTPIIVDGVVTDGRGAGVPDALIEIWQANAEGHWNHPDDPRSRGRERRFDGFGRIHTDPDGRFTIETIKPGAGPAPGGGTQAPHLVVGLFARGLLTRLVTRIYFGDEAGNDRDGVLAQVPAGRRSTLVATPHGTGRYGVELVLQGARETVFFDV